MVTDNPCYHSSEGPEIPPLGFNPDLLNPDLSLVQEIRSLEQLVDTDHTSFIHVENVYENILQQTLDKEVTKGESTITWWGRLPHRTCL